MTFRYFTKLVWMVGCLLALPHAPAWAETNTDIVGTWVDASEGGSITTRICYISQEPPWPPGSVPIYPVAYCRGTKLDFVRFSKALRIRIIGGPRGGAGVFRQLAARWHVTKTPPGTVAPRAVPQFASTRNVQSQAQRGFSLEDPGVSRRKL